MTAAAEEKATKRRKLDGQERDDANDAYYAMIPNPESFRHITSWHNLCELNVRFLEGKIDRTYYHCGPIWKETLPLVPKLVRLNRAGFYTINGQPGMGTPFERQKAMIEGFTSDLTIGKKLCDYLDKQPCFDYMYSAGKTGLFITTFPTRGERIAITIGRDNPDSDPWEVHSGPDVECHFKSVLSGIQNIDRMLNKAGFFIIIHKQYGALESAEDMLLKFFGKNA